MAYGYHDLPSKSETLADYPHDCIRFQFSTQALDTDVRGTPKDCSEQNLYRRKKVHTPPGSRSLTPLRKLDEIGGQMMLTA